MAITQEVADALRNIRFLEERIHAMQRQHDEMFRMARYEAREANARSDYYYAQIRHLSQENRLLKAELNAIRSRQTAIVIQIDPGPRKIRTEL